MLRGFLFSKYSECGILYSMFLGDISKLCPVIFVQVVRRRLLSRLHGPGRVHKLPDRLLFYHFGRAVVKYLCPMPPGKIFGSNSNDLSGLR